MFCPKCGKENSNDVKFCCFCGTPMIMSEQPQNQPMPGTPVQPMAQSQPMPGTPVQPMAQGQPMPYAQSMPQIPPAQPTEKKGNGAVKVLVILIVLLLLICLGILAFMMLNKGMHNRKVQALMNTADEYLEDSNYRLAIDSYLDVLELDSENADAISGLTEAYVKWAESYAEDGDYEAAIDLLENADSQAKAKTLEKTIEELQASIKGDWSDADLIFQSASDTVEAALGYAFITYADGSYLTYYADGSYETYYEDFSTSKGLELGMLIGDYVELYDIKEGFAVWEVYSGDENEYTGFREYTGQSPAEMYDGENNTVWLDIGFCKENGEWKQLMDYEIRDVWFCDASLDDYDECVVFAVNFDSWGEIVGISLEHFAYDENWVEWQDWAE